jgi:Arc/MetJ family transcription regulator
MTVKRTTIELDEDLLRAAQAATGETLRATVERALHCLVAAAEEQASARRQRIANHFARSGAEVDIDVLLSNEAWR